MRIYVGNIPFDTNENNIRDLFSAFGKVTSVVLMRDKFTGQSRGFGYVEMPNTDEAALAIKKLDEDNLAGHVLKVHEAEMEKNAEFGERKIEGSEDKTETDRTNQNAVDNQ